MPPQLPEDDRSLNSSLVSSAPALEELPQEIQLEVVHHACSAEEEAEDLRPYLRRYLKVSRLFQEVARVCLYRTINIGAWPDRGYYRTKPLGATKAFALLRTFLARPDLAMYVEELAVLDVLDQTEDCGFSPEQAKRCLKLLPFSKHYPGPDPWLPGLRGGYLEIAAVFLLCCTKNIRRLEIHGFRGASTPPFEDSSDRPLGTYLLMFLSIMFLTVPSIGTATFPRLEEAATEGHGFNKSPGDILEFMNFPSLQSFSVGLMFGLSYSGGPRNSHLRRLRAFVSGHVQETQVQLADFIGHLPALTNLNLAILFDANATGEMGPQAQNDVTEELNLTLLSQVVQNLENLASLHIHILFCYGERERLVADPQPIESLCSLLKLTDLCLPWWALGAFHRSSEAVDLATMVPSSLQNLTITDIPAVTTGDLWFEQGLAILEPLRKFTDERLPVLNPIETEIYSDDDNVEAGFYDISIIGGWDNLL